LGLGLGFVVRLDQHVAHRVRQLQSRVEVVPVSVDERLAPHVHAHTWTWTCTCACACAIVSRAMVSRATVSRATVSRAIVSIDMVSSAIVSERLAPHVPAELAHELAGHVSVRVDPRLTQVVTGKMQVRNR